MTTSRPYVRDLPSTKNLSSILAPSTALNQMPCPPTAGEPPVPFDTPSPSPDETKKRKSYAAATFSEAAEKDLMQTVNDDAPTNNKKSVLKHLKKRTKKIGKRNNRSISHILLASGSKDGNYLSEINDTVNINEGVAMDKGVSVELKPKEGHITTRSGRKTKAPIW
eukprot:CAMPEP_0194394010 /NCGR_PEP_ID=MMETSP0174-20130528/123616_1 /TAXON_ID=216777 /ORGANISM="Proboscia alata, Strain PI-D3" /LENGTH=165 /DNA_ID=CAMNT_0039189759 /DNA_START=756 /DNA_END=1250 /DNA_ORIENTATION=-